MDVHSNHISKYALRLLYEKSADGSLPSEVDEHIANCAVCMQAYLEIVNEITGLPSIECEFLSVPPRPALRDAAEDDGEATFVPVMPKVRSSCWSDEDLRTQAVLMGTAKFDGELALHARTCVECRSKLNLFFRNYRDEIRRREPFYRRLGLLRLFRRLVTSD